MDIQRQIRDNLVKQWRSHSEAPFPSCRIEEVKGGYTAELYFNADERIIVFNYDKKGKLIPGEAKPLDPDTFLHLIPVYPTIKELGVGYLLTYTFSGLMHYAHGKVNGKSYNYYFCPQCNGYVAGHAEAVRQKRIAYDDVKMEGIGLYCKRCNAELTFNFLSLLRGFSWNK